MHSRYLIMEYIRYSVTLDNSVKLISSSSLRIQSLEIITEIIFLITIYTGV